MPTGTMIVCWLFVGLADSALYVLTTVEDRADYVRTAFADNTIPLVLVTASGYTNDDRTYVGSAASKLPRILSGGPMIGMMGLPSTDTLYAMEQYVNGPVPSLTFHCTATAITLHEALIKGNGVRTVAADSLQAKALAAMLEHLHSSRKKQQPLVVVYTTEAYGNGLKEDTVGLVAHLFSKVILLPVDRGESPEGLATLPAECVVLVLINKGSTICTALADYTPSADREVIFSETGQSALEPCKAVPRVQQILHKAWIVSLGNAPAELDALFPSPSHTYKFPCYAAGVIARTLAGEGRLTESGETLKRHRICGSNFTVLGRTLEFAPYSEGCELMNWEYTITKQDTNSAYLVAVPNNDAGLQEANGPAQFLHETSRPPLQLPTRESHPWLFVDPRLDILHRYPDCPPCSGENAIREEMDIQVNALQQMILVHNEETKMYKFLLTGLSGCALIMLFINITLFVCLIRIIPKTVEQPTTGCLPPGGRSEQLAYYPSPATTIELPAVQQSVPRSFDATEEGDGMAGATGSPPMLGIPTISHNNSGQTVRQDNQPIVGQVQQKCGQVVTPIDDGPYTLSSTEGYSTSGETTLGSTDRQQPQQDPRRGDGISPAPMLATEEGDGMAGATGSPPMDSPKRDPTKETLRRRPTNSPKNCSQ